MRTKYIVFLIALFISCCKTEIKKPVSTESIRVKVAKVSQETLSIPVQSSGIVTTNEETRLSFKTGGIITGIFCKEGDKVKKGDILASLNLSEISAQVNQAKDGYDKTIRDYNRAKNLYNDSVATLEQIQNALTVMNIAKSNLDIAQFNLSHSKIIAPDNGIILKQFVKENEMIAAGYPVFLFGINGRSWKVKASVSDKDIIRVNSGDSAYVKVDAYPGLIFGAIVSNVGEMSNPMTGTYEIELTLNDGVHRLVTGFVADAEIFPKKKEFFLMVPVQSIVEADGQTGFVYAVTKAGIAKKVKIDILRIFGSKATINSNMEEISEIVTEGVAYLKNGQKVEIIK